MEKPGLKDGYVEASVLTWDECLAMVLCVPVSEVEDSNENELPEEITLMADELYYRNLHSSKEKK